MARGTFGPSSYAATAAPSRGSVGEGFSGVTFGCDFAARTSKRTTAPGAMSRARFPPFERYDGAVDESGDPPSRDGQVKACIVCGITETPLWRANDIDGKKNLCNACGVRQNRLKRARRADDAMPHSEHPKSQAYRERHRSSASPRATKRTASARLDRLPPMMGDAVPMSRAWSLGQLGDPVVGDWGPYFDHQASHSDPISLHSTLGAIASAEDTAVHLESDRLSCNRQVDADLESDLDPLDPRFLARIHDPHQR